MLVAQRRTDARLESGASTVALESGASAAVPAPPRPAYAITPLIAVVMLAVTLVAGEHYGIGLRDPDGVVGGRLLLVLGLILAFCALDVVPRAILDARATSRPAMRRIIALAHDRLSWQRLAYVLGSIVAFYVIYLCYRNVKSYLPLARPELFDGQLRELDRSLFGGDPAVFMHEWLGTGVAAHVLSTVYLLFLTFVPISVVVTLVWSRDNAIGLWWVNVLSINGVLGALSYFLMPSMGPAFVSPELFATLPETGATSLQHSLLEHRQAFLQNPSAAMSSRASRRSPRCTSRSCSRPR